MTAELCAVCGTRARAAGGRLSRCLECIKAAADLDRRARAARRKEHDRSRTPPTKQDERKRTHDPDDTQQNA